MIIIVVMIMMMTIMMTIKHDDHHDDNKDHDDFYDDDDALYNIALAFRYSSISALLPGRRSTIPRSASYHIGSYSFQTCIYL